MDCPHLHIFRLKKAKFNLLPSVVQPLLISPIFYLCFWGTLTQDFTSLEMDGVMCVYKQPTIFPHMKKLLPLCYYQRNHRALPCISINEAI